MRESQTLVNMDANHLEETLAVLVEARLRFSRRHGDTLYGLLDKVLDDVRPEKEFGSYAIEAISRAQGKNEEAKLNDAIEAVAVLYEAKAIGDGIIPEDLFSPVERQNATRPGVVRPC